MYRRAGIDIYLSGKAQGQGLGREALALLARYLLEERGHHRLVIDPRLTTSAPSAAISRSASCRWGSCGSTSAGPDGSWHDGLLMDLLREDFSG